MSTLSAQILSWNPRNVPVVSGKLELTHVCCCRKWPVYRGKVETVGIFISFSVLVAVEATDQSCLGALKLHVYWVEIRIDSRGLLQIKTAILQHLTRITLVRTPHSNVTASHKSTLVLTPNSIGTAHKSRDIKYIHTHLRALAHTS